MMNHAILAIPLADSFKCKLIYKKKIINRLRLQRGRRRRPLQRAHRSPRGDKKPGNKGRVVVFPNLTKIGKWVSIISLDIFPIFNVACKYWE